ncbi:PC4-domain-containing protein [Aureobasidium pullulans]|uniref:PC4-domain-containing protein n=1 Tax=Aureobasidium pullulans TaxID=5580 RepID=A0A4S9BJG2_AURPU|nr:PC4-domain-containing protein [Aureobasidium pullulans]
MPPQLSKKRASKAEEYNSDDGFVEDAPKSNKRAKTSQPISKDKQLDDDGNPYWELSGKRRVTLSEFKKMHLINVREYYEKDGKMLPGKKGISLSLEQFSAFLEVLPEIEAALKSKGQELPRPNYASEGPSIAAESEQEEFETETADVEPETKTDTSSNKLDKFKYGKKNHEATSDEED